MDRDELTRRWHEVGAAGPAPSAGGLMGFPEVHEPGGLVGAALVALGLALGAPGLSPAAVRAASAAYAGWAAPAGAPPLRGADYGDVAVDSGDLAATFVRTHERLADIVAVGATPLLLGGDALVTVPALQVLSGKLHGRLGVVAFSPALDIAVEPTYAPASRWARALELDVLAPANLVVVGGRDDPPARPARRVLDGLGAHVYTVADVDELGMAAVAQEALEAAAAGTEALYLSVDLGVLAGGADPVGFTARELVAGVGIVTRSLLAAADVCADGRGGDAPAVAARVVAELVAGVTLQRA